jgi:hypothetical protein
MTPTESERYDEARQRLLEQGTRSYLDAVTAVLEYQKEVHKRCRAVMETYLDDYASALKVRLSNSEIKNDAWPSLANWDGSWWLLGAKIVRKNIPRIRWWETSCCLQYECGENGLFCWVGAWFPTKNMASDVSRRFQRLNRKVMCEGNEVWIQQKLKVEEVIGFDEALEALCQQWIDLWKEVGGIKQVFKRDGARAENSEDT